MDHECPDDADRDDACISALDHRSGVNAPEEQEGEQGENEKCAEKSKFLRAYAVDEIAPLRREDIQLRLTPLQVPIPEQSPRSEGSRRLRTTNARAKPI